MPLTYLPPDPIGPDAGGPRNDPLSFWEQLRRPAHPRDLRLSEFALKWMAGLPPKVRPTGLACRYPRIVNALCLIWTDPGSTRRYFEKLLMDDRGTRQGFPRPILDELSRLRIHYGTLHPEDAPLTLSDSVRR